ncbi:MAG: RNHCP domain-containing protein [Oligoflexia bacterium]|nr:RNHCP domain-containing protein [Oligoflexia bacterium]
MPNSKRFQRKIENFTCAKCGLAVQGDGYTNHCPRCLVSKHVDLNPGDRAASCGGLMRAIALEIKGGKQTIIHRCDKCGEIRRNRAHKSDDSEALIALAQGHLS